MSVGTYPIESITLSDVCDVVKSDRLFAILDSCDDATIQEKVRYLDPEKCACLYSGKAAIEHRQIAPFLVKVDKDMLEWINIFLPEKPWGVFCVSDSDLNTVRKHFKKFLKVQMPDREEFYFRFYDPRVLPIFLETSSETEKAMFFGPVSHFAIQKDRLTFSTIRI